MSQLYPLKFQPILKDKIWGGSKLRTILNKSGASDKCGESWEISGYQNNISVVKEGFLAGNDLQDLIEVYMGDLVGDEVFSRFGLEFPLLIKFIDAADELSIQVHPDDELASKRHNGFGKTEMWYVIQADESAKLISGFNRELDKKMYLEHLQNGTLTSILNFEKVKEGDVFFMPAGRVHAIGKGTLLTEIQQTSDLTYRIYDYDRKDDSGKTRELHTELALDAIDYKRYSSYRNTYEHGYNQPVNLVQCEYFTTNLLELDFIVKRDYVRIDSFVIYICAEGAVKLHYENGEPVMLNAGETVLVPAMLNDVTLEPEKKSKILEVYIKP
ncbi:MAG TPA: type I phosphomannose isomerase catalytic subunit [Bacteroidales bacterium]|nr:type I phosphomannose isomerase catalytic subunit [Bacteroidales bacterium]